MNFNDTCEYCVKESQYVPLSHPPYEMLGLEELKNLLIREFGYYTKYDDNSDLGTGVLVWHSLKENHIFWTTEEAQQWYANKIKELREKRDDQPNR